MKGLITDRVLKQDRFKYPPEKSMSKFEEVEEFNNHNQHYFKVSSKVKGLKYKKFFVNGEHSRIQAYNDCVDYAMRNDYSLTAR